MVPYLVNDGLQLPLRHNAIRQIENKIGKMPPIQPGQACIFRHGKQPLEAPLHFGFVAHAEVTEDIIAEPPDGKIAGIVLPAARYFLVAARSVRHLDRLPDGPGVAVPYQLQESLLPDELHMLFAGQ